MEYLEIYMAQKITTIVLTSNGLPEPLPAEGVYTYQTFVYPHLHKYSNEKMEFSVGQPSIARKQLTIVVYDDNKIVELITNNTIIIRKPEYRKYTATVKTEGNVLTMTFKRTK